MGRRTLLEHAASTAHCPARSRWAAARGPWAIPPASIAASACSLLDRAMMLTAAVDQPVAGHFHQERAKVGPVGEPPARVAQARQHVGPDRLDDVHRVELGAERPAQPAPHGHPQVRLVRQESSLRGRNIAFVQPLDQLIQGIDGHDSLEDQLPGSSGNPVWSAIACGSPTRTYLALVLSLHHLRTTATAARRARQGHSA